MPIPGHGSTPASAATGTVPATPAAGTTPTAPTPVAPATPPAPTASTHTSLIGRLNNPRNVAILVVAGVVGGLFGYFTWDHKRIAWTVGWAMIFMAVTILVLWFLDWINARATTVTTPTLPPATPAAATPPTAPVSSAPCTCTTPPIPPAGTSVGSLAFNGQTWYWDGTNYWCQF